MEDISSIRRFNRLLTQRIGVLNDAFLGRGRSLGASRLLFEIGEAGAELRDLRHRLNLDSGYLSRSLQQLEQEGLINLQYSPDDARVRVAHLTTAGREELAVINQLSDQAAAALLEPLSTRQRQKLTEAMQTIVRLLNASDIHIATADPSSEAAQICLQHYYQELNERFSEGFNELQSLNPSKDELTPPQGYFVVASLNHQPVGCGGLKCHANYGEIKRVWVDPSMRGLGLGQRLLEKLEQLARNHHLSVVRLDTHESLHEAQSLYRKLGYLEVTPYNDERYAHHWFEKQL
jgi:DNA-binding MarR family transcriptional regulator/N-acetylglutamate synthase-like GNAT family acetyltransferase